MSYFLRLDTSSTSDAIKLITSLSSQYIYCIEDVDSDNPHIHALIITDVKDRTIRSRIKACGFTGNRCYSLKKCEELFPIKCVAYILKQSKFYNHGIPEDIVDKAKVYDEQVKKEMKDKKAKKNNKELVLEYVVEQTKIPSSLFTGLIQPYIDLSCNQQMARVGYYVLDFHIKNKLSIRKFSLQQLTEFIFFHISGAIYDSAKFSYIKQWYVSNSLRYGPMIPLDYNVNEIVPDIMRIRH